MLINSIFNPNGDDSLEVRQVWNGNPTNLIQLNDVKYSWAINLYLQMRENFWIPNKVDLTADVTDYFNLLPCESRAYDAILSYLTFLDSIQTCNIPFLRANVTAPEIGICMTEQASQEALHSQSYQFLIESIIPPERRSDIYYVWKEDKILLERCSYIANLYQNYLDQGTLESYFLSLVSNYILEGIYFYNGFIFFYNLASRQLMSGTADMFKLINRDELSHVRLYSKIIKQGFEVFPHSKDQVYELFDIAVKQEINWTNHITGDQILGITPDSTESYTKYLANNRLKNLDLNPLYPQEEAINVYKHLERIADTDGEGSTKANFFESGVTSYNMSSSISGWDDF